MDRCFDSERHGIFIVERCKDAVQRLSHCLNSEWGPTVRLHFRSRVCNAYLLYFRLLHEANQLALIRFGSIEIADHKTSSRMPEIEPATERGDKGQENKRVAVIHGRQVLDHF
jgi:hypothetical protein